MLVLPAGAGESIHPYIRTARTPGLPGIRHYPKDSRAASSRPAVSPRSLPNSRLFGKPLDRSTRSRGCRGSCSGRTSRAVRTDNLRATPKQFPTVGANRSRAKPVKELVRALIKRPFKSSGPAVTEIPPCRSVFLPDLPPTSDSMSAIWDLEGRRHQHPSIPLSDQGNRAGPAQRTKTGSGCLTRRAR